MFHSFGFLVSDVLRLRFLVLQEKFEDLRAKGCNLLGEGFGNFLWFFFEFVCC